jgi:hypothetical protein
MEFVVNAIGPIGDSTWLSAPRLERFPTLVGREGADVFQTRQDAQVAIAKMSAGLRSRWRYFLDRIGRLRPARRATSLGLMHSTGFEQIRQDCSKSQRVTVSDGLRRQDRR